ncbi:hypothetical protein ACIRP7_13755 [Streptomyces sp. NPDC102270]
MCRESGWQGRPWGGGSKGAWLHTGIAVLAWGLVVTAMLATVTK